MKHWKQPWVWVSSQLPPQTAPFRKREKKMASGARNGQSSILSLWTLLPRRNEDQNDDDEPNNLLNDGNENIRECRAASDLTHPMLSDYEQRNNEPHKMEARERTAIRGEQSFILVIETSLTDINRHLPPSTFANPSKDCRCPSILLGPQPLSPNSPTSPRLLPPSVRPLGPSLPPIYCNYQWILLLPLQSLRKQSHVAARRSPPNLVQV